MPYGKRNNRKMVRRPRRVAKSNGIKTTKRIINPQLKAVVKRILGKQQEVKTVTTTLFPLIGQSGNIYSSGINNTVTPSYGATCAISIIPAVGQGTGQGQRIGNKISPVSLLVRGVVNALPISGSTGTNYHPNEPLYVRVVVYCLRSNSTINVNDNLLDQGTTNKNFDGSLSDLLLPYNTERFKIVKSKQFNLQPVYDLQSAATENANKATSRMFKMYIKLPKTLQYADNVNDNNKVRYYIAAGVVNFDGSLLPSTDIRAKIWAESMLKFRDD